MLGKIIFFIGIISAFNSIALNTEEFTQVLKKNHPFFTSQKLAQSNLGVLENIANPYSDWVFSSKILTTK